MISGAQVSSGAGYRFVSPSDFDHSLVRTEYKEALEEAKAEGSEDRVPKLEDCYNYQIVNENGKFLGESIRATWQLMRSGLHPPFFDVLDFCLIEPRQWRTSTDAVDIPTYLNVENVFRSMGPDTPNKRVYKVGRTTGFSMGRIQVGYHAYAHENLPNTWISTHIIKGENGILAGRGDSGSLIVDGGGKVIGILTGAIVGKDPQTEQIYSDLGSYIPISKLVDGDATNLWMKLR